MTDNNTGLVWQQEDDDIKRTGEDALTYCEGLSLAGHNDWRLPNIKELGSIVDYGKAAPAIDETYFPIIYTGEIFGYAEYWSSTAYLDYTNYAWVVNFEWGFFYQRDTPYGIRYVRCVSGGE